MDRRTFIGVVGGLVSAPLGVQAQQTRKVYRIGILEAIPAAQNAANLDALRTGLRNLGYVEGQTWSLNIDRQMVAPNGSRIWRPNWSVSRSI